MQAENKNINHFYIQTKNRAGDIVSQGTNLLIDGPAGKLELVTQLPINIDLTNKALDNNLDRLKEDHKRAKELGDELTDKSFVKRVEKVETNIVVFEIDNKIDKQTIINSFNEDGVLFDWYSMGAKKIRLVTHINYTEKNHIYLLDFIKNLKI